MSDPSEGAVRPPSGTRLAKGTPLGRPTQTMGHEQVELIERITMRDTNLENDITRYVGEKRRRRAGGQIEMRMLQETLECPSTEEIEAARSAAARTCAVCEAARCAFCRLSFQENVDATSIIRTGFCESCLSLLEFGKDHNFA